MDNIATGEQRKLEFENTLLELMQEMPYSKITVTDLAERMHLVRKTFYHYFPGKDACLQSLTDRLILECSIDVLQALPPEASDQQVCEHQLRFWMLHRDFLQAILDYGLNSYFAERYLNYILREELTAREHLRSTLVNCDEDVLYFYITGLVFLLLKWCREGFQLSPEEMARKNHRLVREPLFRQNS